MTNFDLYDRAARRGGLRIRAEARRRGLRDVFGTDAWNTIETVAPRRLPQDELDEAERDLNDVPEKAVRAGRRLFEKTEQALGPSFPKGAPEDPRESEDKPYRSRDEAVRDLRRALAEPSIRASVEKKSRLAPVFTDAPGDGRLADGLRARPQSRDLAIGEGAAPRSGTAAPVHKAMSRLVTEGLKRLPLVLRGPKPAPAPIPAPSPRLPPAPPPAPQPGPRPPGPVPAPPVRPAPEERDGSDLGQQPEPVNAEHFRPADDITPAEMAELRKTFDGNSMEWFVYDDQGRRRRKRLPVFVVKRSLYPMLYDAEVAAPTIGGVGVPHIFTRGSASGASAREKPARRRMGFTGRRPKKFSDSSDDPRDVHAYPPASTEEVLLIDPNYGFMGYIPSGQNRRHGGNIGHFYVARHVRRPGQLFVYLHAPVEDGYGP